MDLSVIIPTYNERENIEELLNRIHNTLQKINYEIIIVDDNSPDKTWQIVNNIAKEKNNLKAIRRTKEKGLSTAVVRGLQKSNGRKK